MLNHFQDQYSLRVSSRANMDSEPALVTVRVGIEIQEWNVFKLSSNTAMGSEKVPVSE